MDERQDAEARASERSGLEPTFEDDFRGSALDGSRWLDHYLPHWTTPERSAARYVVRDGLHLLIEADQPAWRAEDGPMRVSNVQTGSFSGPVGSAAGQHRHRGGLTVRTPQPTRRLWTPVAGRVEVAVAATADPTCMTAIWLVGLEESSPQDSGEICVAELFGNSLGRSRSQVRLGVKAHHDPRLRTEMVDLLLDLDATEPHVYAAAWDAEQVRFFVDGTPVHRVGQGMAYPLQLMVDLFEFPEREDRDPDDYPKSAQVLSVRGYEPR